MNAAATPPQPPSRNQYDVVIIGGAMMGSSSAWFLSANPDFDGSVLVVEKDPTYQYSSTAATNSCIRKQFSNEINVRISQFGVEFLKSFRERLGGDEAIPRITLDSYGYLFLAASQSALSVLKENQRLQASLGVPTRILSRDEIARDYPFFHLDDVIAGSLNTDNEGYFDGATMFDWWKRKARDNGVEYVTNEVVDIHRSGARVTGVALKSGETVGAGVIVNASGPRAGITAAMAGLHIPVEARKRYTFIFDAQTPLDRDLPLTIDPGGVHIRSDGAYYLCGGPPDDDPAVDFDDFEMDHGLWERKMWPAIAARVPAFEAVRVVNSWVGHYAYNTLDQNAVIGFHPEVANFIFVNGFSGHGFQQSPAMGRGVSELVAHGAFRTLDLSPLGYERVAENRPFLEKAII